MTPGRSSSASGRISKTEGHGEDARAPKEAHHGHKDHALTRGARDYDFGDTAETTPLLMMHTLGHAFIPPAVHAGGLRYHGSAPLVSHLLAAGVIEAEAYHQGEVFESAVAFARREGTIPAPESAHAIHSVVRHALAARDAATPKVILFNLSGHGLFDLGAYEAYLGGKMDVEA